MFEKRDLSENSQVQPIQKPKSSKIEQLKRIFEMRSNTIPQIHPHSSPEACVQEDEHLAITSQQIGSSDQCEVDITGSGQADTAQDAEIPSQSSEIQTGEVSLPVHDDTGNSPMYSGDNEDTDPDDNRGTPPRRRLRRQLESQGITPNTKAKCLRKYDHQERVRDSRSETIDVRRSLANDEEYWNDSQPARVGRPQRQRKERQIFTYDTVGGNPKMTNPSVNKVEADGNGSSKFEFIRSTTRSPSPKKKKSVAFLKIKAD